jgi:hypothetical protein
MLNTDYTLTASTGNLQLPPTPSGVATYTFPSNASSATFTVSPIADADIEGSELVVLSLKADGGYLLGAKKAATVTIADGQPFEADRPDAILSRGTSPPVGALVFDDDDHYVTQVISASGKLNKAATFNINVVNRGPSAQDFHVWGGAGANGFDVAYFSNGTDVTNEVVEGSFSFVQLGAGSSGALTLRVTPTSSAALGASLETLVHTRSDTLAADIVKAFVRRVR